MIPTVTSNRLTPFRASDKCQMYLRMQGAGRDPLASTLGVPAPSIQYGVDIYFDFKKGAMEWRGVHDSFPAHEFTIQGEAVHRFSPRAAGTGLFSLFGLNPQTFTGSRAIEKTKCCAENSTR